MNVPSYEFLGLAAIVAVFINLSAAPVWRRAILLIANLGFVSTFTHDPRALGPFAGLLVLGFICMKLLESHKRKALLVGSLVALLLAFIWLKRYTLVPSTLFLPFAYMTVGMSYVFFRIMHVVIDAYQDSLPERIGVISYINYTLNFACLVSGPIQLYPDYRRTESEQPSALDAASLGLALRRIIMGFFKVAVISPVLLHSHERCTTILAMPLDALERALYASLVLAIYPFYIYVNFSGYTDFVIGVARFSRLELPENFARPFLAVSFIDFWGRWHMTLSNWLKTYIYSPLLLGLMRRFPSPRIEPYLGVFTYFVTFFLIGAWHGQTTMFLFYGVLLGLGVSVNKLYQIAMVRRLGRARYRTLCTTPFYAACSRGLTFLWFAFSLLWFWSTWSELAQFIALLGWETIAAAFVIVLCSAALALSVWAATDARLGAVAPTEDVPVGVRYLRTAWYTALALITLSVTAVLNAPAPHIIYRAF